MNSCLTTEKRNAFRDPVAYEIYALKYAGPFTSKLALLLSGKGWDEDAERNYYIWALKSNDEIVIVDTGCRVKLARQQNLAGFEDPLNMLSFLGARPGNVKKILITHMHFDHAGGVESFGKAFPDAVFYVQHKEYDFWAHNPLAKRRPFSDFADEDAVADLGHLFEAEGRVMLIAGDQEIAPGIELLLTPGHTPGLQSVAVNTTAGKAVLASDTIHIKRNLTEEIPSSMITDVRAWIESCDKLKSLASSELIFSGHDSEMLTNYPLAADNITRLA